MKSSTTGELRNPDIALRARNAVRTSTVLIVAFLGTFSLYMYLALTTKTWQLYALAAITLFTSVLNILALRYGRQRKVETVAYLMIAGVESISISSS